MRMRGRWRKGPTSSASSEPRLQRRRSRCRAGLHGSRGVGSSAPFSQLVLRHSDRLTLAAFSTRRPARSSGPGHLRRDDRRARSERATALFGFINLDQDDDGVSRRARLLYRDREGTERPSFAARAASTTFDAPPLSAAGREEFWIDHTIDAGRLDRVSWKDLDATLRTQPERFRNRLVIVGADYAGSGDEARVQTPTHTGVVLHALIAETILSNYPVRGAGTTAVTIAAGVACGMLCAALLLGRNLYRTGVTVALAGIAYAVGAFILFMTAKVLLPVIVPVLICGVGGGVACWIRRHRPAFPLD